MNNEFYLAFRYLSFFRWKGLVLVLALTLTLFMPMLLWMVLKEFDQRISQRARQTPMIVGDRGSGIDLTLSTLYFSKSPPGDVPWSVSEDIQDTGLADVIPIALKHSARGNPVVGTSIDYFTFRDLRVAQGRPFVMLGECVLGSEVAKSLRLGPNDRLLSDRQNLIDLAGNYPLRMHVVGVLAPTKSADDRAVFVDYRTSWIMDGLGHGHEDLETADADKILDQDADQVVASAAVLPYTEITEANQTAIHFHGDQGAFPLTAVVVRAPDVESETRLLARLQAPEWNERCQAVVPNEVIRNLLALIFQIYQIFNASLGVVAIATLALLSLIMVLSTKLRSSEMETMFRMGCRRMTMFRIQLAELILVLGVAGIATCVLIAIVRPLAGTMVERLIVG